MKRLYSSHNNLFTDYLKQLLEDQGISCLVKNELLSGAAGELPPTECWPELWIIDDAQYQRAQEIVASALSTDPSGHSDWTCPKCGEALEAQFTACWNCGTSRPSEAGSSQI